MQQIRSQHVCLDGPVHAVLLFSTTVAFTKDSAEILGAHDVRAPLNARNGEIVTVRPHRLICLSASIAGWFVYEEPSTGPVPTYAPESRH